MKKIELNQEIMSIYEKQMNKEIIKSKEKQPCDIIDNDDFLQEAIIAILEKQEIETQKVNDTTHLFNRLKRQKKWDLYRKNKKRIEKLECHFEEIQYAKGSDMVNVFGNENMSNIYNNQIDMGFNDTVELIKSKLSHDDYLIFDLYFLQDKTVRQIAKIINNSVMTTNRIINKVQNHIMRMKITEIHETRYLMTGGTCKGRWPEKKGTPSECKRIDKTGFIPATKKQFNPAGFNPIETPKKQAFIYDTLDYTAIYYRDKMKGNFKFYRNNLRLVSCKQYQSDSINTRMKYPDLNNPCKMVYSDMTPGNIEIYKSEGYLI